MRSVLARLTLWGASCVVAVVLLGSLVIGLVLVGLAVVGVLAPVLVE